MDRLTELLANFQSFPGRAPNGNGATGLAANDYQGFMQMLRERQEAVELQTGQPIIQKMGTVGPAEGRQAVAGFAPKPITPKIIKAKEVPF